MLDIDHFKLVNDTHGHATGDAVLRAVADRLRTATRESDIVGRYSGEEFALIVFDAADASEFAERLRATVADTVVPVDSGSVRVTISVGVSHLRTGDDLDTLLGRADKALYQSKADGRNRVTPFLNHPGRYTSRPAKHVQEPSAQQTARPANPLVALLPRKGRGVDLMEPTLLGGRYRIDGLIASGGMGTVHRGWDSRLARPVALKVLHRHLAADADFERRFRAEARHAARVRHPHVVAVLDQDEHDGVPFIVMELISGRTLRDVLGRQGRLAPDEVARVVEPACAGLSVIHRSGIVHRDVKPENLLIDDAGVVRVADFGIAHALDATRCTPAGILLGSVRYMAPEVVLGGQASPASDQYALGVVLFEALTGRAPLSADDPAALALRHAHEDVPPPSSVDPSIPAALDGVITTAAARRPEDRYPTLGALNASFQAAVAGGRPASPAVRAGAAGTQPRSAPYLPTVRQGPVPAERTPAPREAGPPAAQGWRPRALHEGRVQAPRRSRQPVSVLAVVAVIFSLFDGVGGFVLAPVFGWVALHRITRRPGHLRGMWVAQVAIGVSALRLLDHLATRGA